MVTPSRRQFLCGLTAAGTAAVAGCLGGPDSEPEFLVTDTAFSIQENGDMRVQVTIENSTPERQSSDLEVTVRYDGGDEPEEWLETDSVSLGSGTEMTRPLDFEDVYRSGAEPEDYEIEADLIDAVVADENS